MRERFFEIVERAEDGDSVSYAYDVLIAFAAVLSVTRVIVLLSGDASGLAKASPYIDAFSVTILLFDYILRWMTYDLKCAAEGIRDRQGREYGARAFAKYPFTLLAVVDLVALLPSLVVLPAACNCLILLRFVKVLRVLRGLRIIRVVFVREGRTLLSVMVVTLAYVASIALLMYTIEPDTFGNFIDAFYWSTTSLATIGYGDISPQTDIGKIVNIVSAFVGVAVVALPSGIITGGYVTEVRRQKESGIRRKHQQKVRPTFVQRFENRFLRRGDAKASRSIPNYFQQHPKVLRYLLIIVACFALNYILSLIQLGDNAGLRLDYWGTALCAFLLEPAAGVFVGLCGILSYAVSAGSVSGLLYIVQDVGIAVTFGLLISLRGRARPIRDLGILIALVIAASATSALITVLVGDMSGDSAATLEYMKSGGVETVLMTVLAYSGTMMVNMLASYVIALFLRPAERRLRELDARDDAANAEDAEDTEDADADGTGPKAADALAPESAASDALISEDR